MMYDYSSFKLKLNHLRSLKNIQVLLESFEMQLLNFLIFMLIIYFPVHQQNFDMGLFFWDFTDYNDIEREWAMFIVNILACCFATYSLYRTARFHGKVMFDLMPLSINAAATFVLLFIKLFEKGYEFDLVGYVIEIFTYFLFCYTFSVMHSKFIAKSRIKLNKICNILFLFAAIGSVVIIALIISPVISKDCDNNLIELSIAGFATQFISYVPTCYFGYDILRNITKKHQLEKVQSSKELTSELFAPVSDQYIKQRKKQIKLVLIAYTVSLLLRGLILIINFDYDSYFQCVKFQDVMIVTSDQILGQFLLVVIQINQLIPHMVIPIALYVIPMKSTRQSKSINLLTQTLIQEQDDDNDHSDIIQRRISNTMLKRSISSSNITSS